MKIPIGLGLVSIKLSSFFFNKMRSFSSSLFPAKKKFFLKHKKERRNNTTSHDVAGRSRCSRQR
jgi:hypothetical protein